MVYTACYKSPLGNIILASDGEALTGLWFEGQKYFGSTLPENHMGLEGLKSGRKNADAAEADSTPKTDDVSAADSMADQIPVLADTRRWLDLYFQGDCPDFLPQLSFETTPFRKAVWEILLTIPYGKTMTYGEIAAKVAEQLGRPSMSAQAVGGAVGHNPISIIVPCHRVVGTDGSLTGYAGGLERKERLLDLEKLK